MKSPFSLLPLAMLFAACSGGPPPEPPAPPPPDPTGIYDCQFDVEGMLLTGAMTITGDPGAYTGTLDGETGRYSLTDIAVDGNQMTFSLDREGMLVSFVTMFDDDGLKGEFDVEGYFGSLTGKKRSP
jgi:hypothetical protein